MKIHTPEDVGLSSERLQRISPLMQDFVKNDQMPGVMTLVQRRGKVAHFDMFGHMDIEAKKPMQEDALFRIYSMTKPITSIALMMLFEEGCFGINDPVANYIPAFKDTKVYAGMDYVSMKLVEQDQPMTIRHLMTHTSGLSYGWYLDSPVETLYREAMTEERFNRDQNLQELVERLAQLPLLFQPGTNWRYSMATDVLGYLVQTIANMPFADFLEERIFKPLGMIDTAFDVPVGKVQRLAQIYESDDIYNPRVIEVAPGVLDVTTPTKCPLGGGGLVSTLDDYLRFCNSLINDGQHLIAPKTLQWMTKNHIPGALFPLSIGPDEMYGYGFGLGFRVMVDTARSAKLTSSGEYGWGGAAKTYFWVDPQEEIIGLLMTQYMPQGKLPIQERFHNLVYQAIID
jgi:CubicO group peptidase (beta-lactamase class C family)